MSKVQLIWFGNDLRVHDNAALSAACASKLPILPLYIFDPSVWADRSRSRRQAEFVWECLEDLDRALKKRGSALRVAMGPPADILSRLHKHHGLAAIHTAMPISRPIEDWARRAGISVRQAGGETNIDPQSRVVWETRMQAPRKQVTDALFDVGGSVSPWPALDALDLPADPCPGRQSGGRSQGLELLRSFLASRGRRYRGGQDNALTAPDASSRLSPHIAHGTLSIREIYQATNRARMTCETANDAAFAESLATFMDRLFWRSRPVRMPVSPREAAGRDRIDLSDPRLLAWLDGRTGLPFLDACLRGLKETGWLSFKQRALVISFAANHLWMDWQVPAQRLAARLVDFDPVIHFSQSAAVAGANGQAHARIYNPVKQGLEQDPDGMFIRRWVPELAGLPAAHIHAPWEAPVALLASCNVRMGETYPRRLVEHVAAARAAREKLQRTRTGSEPGPVNAVTCVSAPDQLTLDFGDMPLPIPHAFT